MKEDNEQSEKLEYTYNNKNTFYDFFIMAIIILVVWRNDPEKASILVLGAIVFGWYIVYLLNNNKLKRDEEIKYKGIKERGIITNAYSLSGRRKSYFLTVEVDKQKYTIDKIEWNDAFYLIENYLNVKRNRYLYEDDTQDMLFDMDIEIDIYINESKVYADLESVDIAAIEKRYNFYKNKQKEQKNYHRI